MGYVGNEPTAVPLTGTDLSDGIIAKNHIAEDRGAIGGLTCSNNGTDADHDLDIAVGYATDYGNAVVMELTTAITKQIDATWAVGTNAGGLDTGAVAASTGYGVYLIRRSDTGVVDVLFSTDMSAAGSSVTMPTNYSQKRLIGWVRTDSSSNILAFTQSGDYFRLTGDVVVDVNDSTMTSTTYETGTMTCPPLCEADMYAALNNSGETATTYHLWLRTKGSTEDTATSNETAFHINSGTGNDQMDAVCSAQRILVDSSSQLEYTCTESAGTASVVLTLFGCNMITRSNP